MNGVWLRVRVRQSKGLAHSALKVVQRASRSKLARCARAGDIIRCGSRCSWFGLRSKFYCWGFGVVCVSFPNQIRLLVCFHNTATRLPFACRSVQFRLFKIKSPMADITAVLQDPRVWLRVAAVVSVRLFARIGCSALVWENAMEEKE